MSPLEQILHNQKKTFKLLAELNKRLDAKESSDEISADDASIKTGYKKDSLRKKNLTKNYRAGKIYYSLKELKQRNLI